MEDKEKSFPTYRPVPPTLGLIEEKSEMRRENPIARKQGAFKERGGKLCFEQIKIKKRNNTKQTLGRKTLTRSQIETVASQDD